MDHTVLLYQQQFRPQCQNKKEKDIERKKSKKEKRERQVGWKGRRETGDIGCEKTAIVKGGIRFYD